jgi:hypothetical protein
VNSVKSGIVTVVLGVGIAGLLITTALSQAGREEQAEKQKPQELWRQYPLDPEAERKGQGSRAQTSQSPSPADEERSDGRGEVASGSSSWPLLIAIAFGGAGALLIVMTVRRVLRPDPPTHANGSIQTVSEARPVSQSQAPAQDMADPSVETQPEPGLVRVHLRDGRTMAGAVKHAPTQDSPVLLLDVVDVSDAQGHKRDPEPLDAFVPLVEIEHVESIDETDAGEIDVKELRQ